MPLTRHHIHNLHPGKALERLKVICNRANHAAARSGSAGADAGESVLNQSEVEKLYPFRVMD